MSTTKRSPRSAVARELSTVDAVVLKDENIYFLTARDGTVPLGGQHALGLYYHDTRFLDGYELTIGDARPEGLAATASSSYKATFELTNAEISSTAHATIQKQRIGIKWERLIASAKLSLLDRITFRNYDMASIKFPIALTFQAGFQDIFIIRGAKHKKTGHLQAPTWNNGALTFKYKGVDEIYRSLTVHVSPKAEAIGPNGAKVMMALEPGESKQLKVSLAISESSEKEAPAQQDYIDSDFDRVESALGRKGKEWLAEYPEFESDSRLFNDVMARSLRDHRVLRSTLDREYYFAAGLPWFGALFGRDSLIAAFEMLCYSPSMAEQTLRLLAKYQGKRLNPTHEEEPGKILHELRLGELANSKQILQTPYYGSVDATPLFLILLGHHAAWTGDLSLFHELRENVDLALEWLDKYGDIANDGYLRYQSKTKGGLANQGWKDSGDGIVNADGTLATPPIALVEVQGYVYLAKTCLADLYRRADTQERADQLLEDAANLRAHFNRDFWMEDKNSYALALQHNNRPAAVISSNAGQALWSGIIDPNKAKLVADRLMADDMFSGWGVRTLAECEQRYNPVGYHIGTVWPHDNAIIAAGLRKYGLDRSFQRIFGGMIEAAARFEHQRLPEVFAGFARNDYDSPVPYPEACHPQVWAAGAVPMMLQTALGLVPLGFERRLRIVSPLLPPLVRRLEVHRLKVGNATVSLRFERNTDDLVKVQVLKVDGDLTINIEPDQ